MTTTSLATTVYACSGGDHDIVVPLGHVLDVCPVYVLGAPCAGELTAHGAGATEANRRLRAQR